MSYELQRRDLLANADGWHAAYYRADPFRGPSLYFHQRALATRQDPTSPQHLEYVYATLASWGMHRMGKGGSKMQAFDVFCASVEPLEGKIRAAQAFGPDAMDEARWAVLKEIFCGLKIMASGTSLVGNSKVMHHMLPNVIPPIDREYTLRILRRNTNIANDLGKEWLMIRRLIEDFFIPVVCDMSFAAKAQAWTADRRSFPWDTSPVKFVDNLLIGSRK